MRSTFSLLGVALSAGLLLASCNAPSTPKPDNGGGDDGGITQPVTGTITATVYRAVTLGAGSNSQAEIRIGGSTTKTATATVTSAPAGLSVTPDKSAPLPSGEISIPLTVTGQAKSGDIIKVEVKVAGNTASVEVPVLAFKTISIAATGLSSPYSAASLRFQPDGSLLLASGLGGSSTDRGSLVKYDPSQGAFSLIPMNLKYPSEAITSQTTAPDGTLWVTVRGITAKGSYLVSRDPSGNTQNYFPDAAGDNLFNLASTADGRIWFTQYTRAAIKALTPSTGNVQSYPVTEQADSLIRGADGKLYYSSFYARPAIVQLDPATGSSKSFNVGDANRSLPVALTAASDGSIWFIEARSGTVWKLDPATGAQTQFALPSGARPTEIALTGGGKVWVSDATNGVLYTTFVTSSGKSVMTAYRSPAGNPSALQAGPDGKVWYVAAGQLVTEQ